MNAQEARLKTATSKDILAEKEFQLCMEEIEKAVSRGSYYTAVPDQCDLYPSTMRKLQSLGYKVKGPRISWGKN